MRLCVPADSEPAGPALRLPSLQDGQLLAPREAANAPHAAIRGGSEGGLYTLIASDPDPPGEDMHVMSCYTDAFRMASFGCIKG